MKTTYKSGAFQVGSRQRARKYLHRDMMLGFHIKDTASLWEFNDSEFRRMFDYELDRWALVDVPTTIEFETELSGTRKLDVLLWDTPDFNPKVDPAQNQHSNLILPLRAGQPLWYSDDYISTFTSSGTSGSGTVTVQNLTDQEAHHKWVLTPAVWSLPDREWVGDRGARTTSGSRTVSGITVTTENGGAVVDRDLNELMFRDANNTNILAQLAGKFFEYSIPLTPRRKPCPSPIRGRLVVGHQRSYGSRSVGRAHAAWKSLSRHLSDRRTAGTHLAGHPGASPRRGSTPTQTAPRPFVERRVGIAAHRPQ